MNQSASLKLCRTPFAFSLGDMDPQLGFIGLGQMGQVHFTAHTGFRRVWGESY